jgi:hypothetical protein
LLAFLFWRGVGVEKILDRFQVLVRQCKPLQPDGYEITVEVRRRQQPAPADDPLGGRFGRPAPIPSCGQEADGAA